MNDRLLPEGYAVKALNANLEDGELKPWPCPQPVCTFTQPVTKLQIINHDDRFEADPCEDTDPSQSCDCGVLGLSCASDIVHYPLLGKDFYITLAGNTLYGGTAEMICEDRACQLSSPKPTSPPVINETKLEEPRQDEPCKMAFFYTFVNECGLEGPPSPVAITVHEYKTLAQSLADVAGGDQIKPIEVFWPNPPPNIQSVRLYRSEVGYRTGEEGAAINDSGFFLTADIPVSEGLSTDTVYDLNSSVLFDETQAVPPPPELKHLALMENGALIGANECRVYFSAPPLFCPRPHLWPGDKDLLLNSNVEAIVVQRSGAFIITDGAPYYLSINSSGDTYFYQEQEADLIAPLASKGSVVDTGDGVLYLSTKGIVRLTPPGRSQGFSASVISHNHFNFKQWRDLDLRDAQAVALDGKYIFLTRCKGYVWFYGSGAESVSEPYTPMSEIDLLGHPDDIVTDKDNRIYYVKDGQLYLWDLGACANFCPYDYISKPYTEPGCTTMTAAKVLIDQGGHALYEPGHVHDDGELTFSLYTLDCDLPVLRKELSIHHCKPFRLPSNYRGVDFIYRLQGTRTVYSVNIARGMRGLARVPNAS